MDYRTQKPGCNSHPGKSHGLLNDDVRFFLGFCLGNGLLLFCFCFQLCRFHTLIPGTGTVAANGNHRRNAPADGPGTPDAGGTQRRPGEYEGQQHPQNQVGEGLSLIHI